MVKEGVREEDYYKRREDVKEITGWERKLTTSNTDVEDKIDIH